MSKPGGWVVTNEYVDKALGMHVIHLENLDTGAQHKLQVMVSHDACPHCGHVTAKDNLGEIDPRLETKAQIKTLNQAGRQMDEYETKHRIPRRKK